MKNFKIILMAGLLAGVFSQTALAAGGDPNLDKPVEGAADLAEGASPGCNCTSMGGRLTDKPRNGYEELTAESGAAAGAASKSEHGTDN